MASIDVSKIHIGPGNIFIGGTAPTAGTDPTDPTAGTPSALAAATTGFAGVDTGGTYVGATNGPATFNYAPTFYQVITEQAFAEVLVVPTAEEVSLAFNAQQLTYDNVHAAYGQTVTRVVVGPPAANVNYGGGLGTVNTQVTCLVSQKYSGTGYYIVTLYRAYSAQGAQTNFERRAETRLPITLRALADAARPVGDQLYQFVDYTANPA